MTIIIITLMLKKYCCTNNWKLYAFLLHFMVMLFKMYNAPKESYI